MKRDTSNQILPARDAFRFVDSINRLWLAAHPDVLRVIESRTMASDTPPLPGADFTSKDETAGETALPK